MNNGRIGDELRDVIEWLDTQTVLEDEFALTCWNRLKAVDRIRVSNQIKTACMKPFSNGKYVIYLNPAFLEKYVLNEQNTVSNFSFVLLHEVLHRERRDGTRELLGLEQPWTGSFKNYVLDVLVNSTLYRRGFPPTETVTKQMYNVTSMRFMLLPPHHLLDGINQASGVRIKPPVESFGTKPYTEYSDTSDLRNFLTDHVKGPLQRVIDESKAHDRYPTGEAFDRLFDCYLDVWFNRPSLKQLAKTLFDVLTGIPVVKPLGTHGDKRGGMGRGDGVTEEIELDTRWKRKVNEFVRIVKKALVRSDESTTRRQKSPQRSIRPSMDRRSSYLLASRAWPVFFENTIEAKRRTREAAYVYVDSSSSMRDEMVHLISSLVLGADEYISNPIYLFTTEVKPVKLKELRSGLRLSGGTRINAPLDHAREKGLEQLIVFTDGHVEDLKSKNRRYLEENNLFTFFNYQAGTPLSEYSTEYWENIEDMILNQSR